MDRNVYCRLDDLQKRVQTLETLLEKSELALADAIRYQPKKICKDDIVVVTKDTKYNIKGKLAVVTIITTSAIDPTVYTVELSSGTSVFLNFDDIAPATEEQKTEWKKEKHAHSFSVGQIVVDTHRNDIVRIVGTVEKNGVPIECATELPDGQQFDQEFSKIIVANSAQQSKFKQECVAIYKENIDSLFKIMSEDEKKDARQKIFGEESKQVDPTKNVFFVDDVVVIVQEGHYYFQGVAKVVRVAAEHCTVETVCGTRLTFAMNFLQHVDKKMWKAENNFYSMLRTMNRLEKVALMAKICELLKEE